MYDEIKRTLRLVFISLLLLGIVVPASGAEYPSKTITMIIPFPAGGSTDLTSRALANAAEKHLGQQIICENKPGGAGGVGPSLVLTKPADGYTIGIITTTPLINWHRGALTFDPVEGLTHIMRWGGYQVGLMVKADSPWKTAKELIEYSKQNPKKVSYGSPGMGTPNHLTMEELGGLAGVQWLHIPYKGDSEMAMALLGGHVEAISGPIQAPLVEASKVVVLATYGLDRSIRFSQVPTLKESGYDITCPVYVGLMGPKGMPKPVMEKLHDAFRKAMDDAEFKTMMQKYDMPLLYLDSKDYERHVRQDSKKIEDRVRKLGLDKKP
jgi:tripartite-type tricarboxylate transporter receptor subunit TctC